jgi:hypothetical protein
MGNLFHFIEIYFKEEQIESLFFVIIGSIALLLAGIFLFIIKYSFFKGFAIPFLVIGFIQLGVGLSIYNRSEKDIIRVIHFIKQEPKKTQTEEIPRMEKVIQNFIIYRWIELILIIGSTILFIAFYKSPQTFWKGIALGLLIQSGITLSLDVIAEKRGHIYLETLQQISKR